MTQEEKKTIEIGGVEHISVDYLMVEQRANFKKLAEILEEDLSDELDMKFDMNKVFTAHTAHPDKAGDGWLTAHEEGSWLMDEFGAGVYRELGRPKGCGAVGCAIGWAAAFGIGGSTEPGQGYLASTFRGNRSEIWHWIFSSEWAGLGPDEKAECAARIRYMLFHEAVPEDGARISADFYADILNVFGG